MNALQAKAANIIDQYNTGKIHLDQLEREILALNPYDVDNNPEHDWWKEDLQEKFNCMTADINTAVQFLGNGSNGIIAYLETSDEE